MADKIVVEKGIEINKGDKMWVYTSRGSGSNYQGEVTQVDPSDNTIFLKVSRRNGGQPHRSQGWYKPRISGKGIPYCKESEKLS